MALPIFYGERGVEILYAIPIFMFLGTVRLEQQGVAFLSLPSPEANGWQSSRSSVPSLFSSLSREALSLIRERMDAQPLHSSRETEGRHPLPSSREARGAHPPSFSAFWVSRRWQSSA